MRSVDCPRTSGSIGWRPTSDAEAFFDTRVSLYLLSAAIRERRTAQKCCSLKEARIVDSALLAGCTKLPTGDLQHRQMTNPFAIERYRCLPGSIWP